MGQDLLLGEINSTLAQHKDLMSTWNDGVSMMISLNQVTHDDLPTQWFDLIEKTREIVWEMVKVLPT